MAASQNYVCSFCGKGNVKLWRPQDEDAPLICACCAEKRQSKLSYNEMSWTKKRNVYHGTPTGRTIPLKPWKVDDDGCVPSYRGPGPKGAPSCRTTTLIVKLDKSKTEVSMVPAVEDFEGVFYQSVPRPMLNWWKNLPTR